MNAKNQLTAVAALAVLIGAGLMAYSSAHAAELTMYEHPDFGGSQLLLHGYTPNINSVGFNDKASSVVVESGRWEVCTDANFKGFCAILSRGEYRSLDPRLNNRISSAREVGSYAAETGAYRPYGRGSIQLFGQPGMGGRSITLDRDAVTLQGTGMDDRASSMVITEGTWQLCADANYGGNCRVYAPGRYADLGYGMGNQISSARLVRPASEAPAVVSGGYGRPVGPNTNGKARALLFSDREMAGSSMAVSDAVVDLQPSGFNRRASSVLVENGTWQFCSEPYFRGECRVMGPGRYPLLADVGMERRIASIRPVNIENEPARMPPPPPIAVVSPPPAPVQVITTSAPSVIMAGVGIELFGGTNFSGGRFATNTDVANLSRQDINDRASSMAIYTGQWEVCTDTNYNGRCVVYRTGRYPDLGGMSNQISSVRRVD